MSFFHKHSLTIVVPAVVANVKAILVSIRLAIIWIRRSSISEVKNLISYPHPVTFLQKIVTANPCNRATSPPDRFSRTWHNQAWFFLFCWMHGSQICAKSLTSHLSVLPGLRNDSKIVTRVTLSNRHGCRTTACRTNLFRQDWINSLTCWISLITSYVSPGLARNPLE